jgi:heme-degrading monooxygenase HmoA
MVKLFVRHQVADYKKWRAVFDELEPLRKSMGGADSFVYCSAENPNKVLVLTEWSNKADAQKFSQSQELKDGMQKGGVISAPEVSFSD